MPADNMKRNPFDPDRQKIRIILGGSFNPPTLAHAQLLYHAMREIGMGTGQMPIGMLVPSSDAYVSRKIKKSPAKSSVLFTESQRLKMLENCASPMIEVSTVEYGDDGRGHTYRTLSAIKSKYPNDRIMFLAGADKLRIIPRWRDAEKLLSEFTVVMCTRNEGEAEDAVRADPFLKNYIGSFWFIPELPARYASMSSTLAREAVLAGKARTLYGLCGYENARYIEELGYKLEFAD